MMNPIFYAIVAVAFLFAIVNGTPADIGKAALDSAKGSVDLAIGLVGYISLFLGLMQVVQSAGGLDWMARLIRPILVRLFPDVPADHPAMGAMIMNLSANALGLGNAATPFGLKAMKELDAINPNKGTATDAMVLFLAINTSGIALLPTGIIGLRAQAGSVDPAAIFTSTLLATSLNTIIAVVLAKLLCSVPPFATGQSTLRGALVETGRTLGLITLLSVGVAAVCGGVALVGPLLGGALGSTAAGIVTVGVLAMGLGIGALWFLPEASADLLRVVLFGVAMVGLVSLVYVYKDAASAWIIPSLIFGMLTVGVIRKIKVYEEFVKGAKEGFTLALTIIPYLVAILSAVGMLRASGGLDRIVGLISPFTAPLGLPGEVLPLAFLRPLSGSGAFALTAELIKTHGPDSYIGQLASTMNGSSETTFYVLAVYFGSVGISKTRHAVPTGIGADFAGVVASVIAVKLLL